MPQNERYPNESQKDFEARQEALSKDGLANAEKEAFKQKMLGDMSPRDIKTMKQKLYDLNIITDSTKVNGDWDDETSFAFEQFFKYKQKNMSDGDIFKIETGNQEFDNLVGTNSKPPKPYPSEHMGSDGGQPSTEDYSPEYIEHLNNSLGNKINKPDMEDTLIEHMIGKID
jgi:hypothetical protein